MNARAATLALFGLAAACATLPTDGADSPAILTALDEQADGFIGATETGARFEIESTSVSATRLCRVVSIDSGDRFDVESFCKAPGGSWR